MMENKYLGIMKKLFFLLVLFFLTELSFAAQPLRKPFFQILVDGKTLKSGDVLFVKNGQKLKVEVEMQGGRRDYCKFPDTYADIVGSSQILTRGENGITYEQNGQTSTWKLSSEKTVFNSDNNLKVVPLDDQRSAEITVSNENFEQTFLQITNTANWQFTQNDLNLLEENKAEETIYIRIQGKSDIWYQSTNIQASGLSNEVIQAGLIEVQAACDSIEANFYRINISGIQQAIRNLQTKVNTLKNTIDEVKAGKPSYKVNVVFIGLPSDQPFGDVELMSNIKTNWVASESSIQDIKSQLDKLSDEATSANKNMLVDVIAKYSDWQNQLPEKTFFLLKRYLPVIELDKITLPENIHFIAEQKTVSNYSKTLQEYKSFLDLRTGQIPLEIERINAIHTKIQSFRLFDGMLRSYFSSIIWAEWQSKRGF